MFGVLDLSNTMVLYYVVLAIFAAGFLLIYRIIHSPFGQVLKAIRENEARAISLGYKTDQYKLLAYILSGTLAGFAMVFFAFSYAAGRRKRNVGASAELTENERVESVGGTAVITRTEVVEPATPGRRSRRSATTRASGACS